MQSKEFQLLATNAAIDHVTVCKDPKDGGEWAAFAYGEEDAPLGVRNVIEAARGGHKTWASLDTAHAWLRSSGWNGAITIDG